MLFNKDIHKEKDKEAILDAQMGGWLIESHCWGAPNLKDIQTCEWCGLEKHHLLFAGTDYPMCEKNPRIIHEIQAELHTIAAGWKKKAEKNIELSGQESGPSKMLRFLASELEAWGK